MFPCRSLLFAGLLMLAPIGAASADVIHKQDGGKVTGTILSEESGSDFVIVKTRFGKLKINRSDVKEIEFTGEDSADYQEVAKRYKETAEDQYALALWCLEHRLRKEYAAHLEKVVTLDPDHAEARSRLGYQKVGDRWLTRDEYMEAQGYVKHKGKYVLPQEKTLLEKKESGQKGQSELYRNIRLWQGWLRGGDEARKTEAAEKMTAIRDPLAIEPLMAMLGEKGTDAERRMLVGILKEIPGQESTAGLVRVAIEDSVQQNRLDAIEQLTPRKTPLLVSQVAGYLTDNDNSRIRRSAALLKEIGDPSVVPALVQALVTTHKTVIQPSFMDQARSLSGYSVKPSDYIVQPDGTMIRRSVIGVAGDTGGFNVGNPPGPKIIIEEKKNPDVLEALIAITGQDFGYSEARWLNWVRQNARDDAAKVTKDR